MQTDQNELRATFLATHLFHASIGDSFPINPSQDDLRELISRSVDPNKFTCVNEFRDAYWRAESFSKTPFLLEGVDREATAYEKFFEAEEACALANQNLVDGFNRPGLPFGRLSKARDLIRAVLGPFSWDQARRYCSFGPGATTSLPRARAAHGNKWQSRHVTRACLPLVLALAKENPGWAGNGLKLEIVAGNKVTTVPKNAKTDRVIAIEPDWNMFFQRAIGGLIRYRLNKRLGLLTPSAQHDHIRMAREASRTDGLATIDLKSASDSVSLALCELLLPADWLSAILITRSQVGTVRGETITYEKVSSMGNGYTFELETLLFWALTRATCKLGTVSVYGDDIICPREHAQEVIGLLGVCGFSCNTKKTFIAGPFRESCGGHFFNGHEVTPPYFRNILKDEIHFVSAANRISACASQRWSGSRDIRFRALHRYLSSQCRFYGPCEAGDGVVHAEFSECCSRRSIRWCRSLQQWRVRCLQPFIRRSPVYGIGAVFASIWGRVTEESFSAKRTSWRVGRMTCNGWTGPGDWV